MADHELPDLAPARAHDAELFRRGLPHAWDVSGIETRLVLAMEGTENAADWASLLEHILDAFRSGLDGSASGIEDARAMIEGLRELRTRIEAKARAESSA